MDFLQAKATKSITSACSLIRCSLTPASSIKFNDDFRSRVFLPNLYRSQCFSNLRIPLRAAAFKKVRVNSGDRDDFEVMEMEEFENGLNFEDEDDEMMDTGLDIVALEDLDKSEAQLMLTQENDDAGTTLGWSQLGKVDYLIDESQFHKISLHECDFFIKIAADRDQNVYDFTEIYVTTPTSKGYLIPRIKGTMPEKPVRCHKGEWIVLHSEEPLMSSQPRQSAITIKDFVAKVFLIKHHLNRRKSHTDFVLNFDEIYVLDSAEKSIQRAEIQYDVPLGKDRNRMLETLSVRDQGSTFRVILATQKKTADQLISEFQWDKSKKDLDNHLRTYRDYEKSNWF